MFDKILIANRGEIALRIIRTCRDMGVRTVAVHSTADTESMHVRLADEAVCIGPPQPANSYLSIQALISAAIVTGADAIHPGVGFLAENATFAEMVQEHGFVFIGPDPKHIRIMGDKISAKRAAAEAGIPLVPGSDGPVGSISEARLAAEKIGYPVLIKAASGGGGKGMKVAENAAALEDAFTLATAEAMGAFGDPRVYMERYLNRPRHIEVQVMGDSHGNVVHYGERDCSLQRRHQKLIEEAPSPVITPEQRAKIGNIAINASKAIGYLGAGTMEFLFDGEDFFFIEMNTRLQVEHTISEMVCGVDLVEQQLRVAAGAPLGLSQKDIKITGHSIECRINAEDPWTFLPSPGKLNAFHAPGGLGVRIDSAMFSGASIPPYYDSMIAKLIVTGDNRAHCIDRLRRALKEFAVDGVKTTIPLHEKIIAEPDFIKGQYDIAWLEEFLDQTDN